MKRGCLICLMLCLLSGCALTGRPAPSAYVAAPVFSGTPSTPGIPPVTATPSPSPAPPYAILGASAALNEAQQKSMSQWREDARRQATADPDHVLLNGDSRFPRVALTFDDGPDKKVTPAILDILKQAQVHATFFVLGELAASAPEVILRMKNEGHLIASHSQTHADYTRSSAELIRKDLTKCDDTLRRITGEAPQFFRPPYGILTPAVTEASGNRKIVLWSLDTLDWSVPSPEAIAGNVSGYLRPGEIILMHCNGDKQKTLAALPEILRTLQNRGLEPVTLDQLLP